ncbi:MAG TPA: hypothetical protein VFD41_02530 [Actinomycetales bacterium]|nr:hypothetical protein [Actinomycetales bacterium]
MSTVPVVVDDGQRLDLKPPRHRTVDDPVLLQDVELGAGRRQRLHQWRDVLLHLGDQRVTRVDAPGPEADVAHLFPSTDEGPVVLAVDGSLHRWTENGLAALGWPLPGDPKQVSAVGLGPRTFVRDFGARSSELRESDTGAPVWDRATVALSVVPVGGTLVGLDLADRTTVWAIRLDDGAERWRARAGVRVDHLVAAVGDQVWVALDDGDLQALDVRTGEVRASVAHPAIDGHARGPVTEAGSLVLCRSTDLTVVDLVRAEVHHGALTGGPAVPRFVRVDLDGRLVVVDERQRVWLVGSDRQARPIHQSTDLVTGLEIHAGVVYVLTSAGRLTVLG